MKSTGIVRHIDNLGRITLPIELRKSLDMACGDPLEIYTEGNSVILRPSPLTPISSLAFAKAAEAAGLEQ